MNLASEEAIQVVTLDNTEDEGDTPSGSTSSLVTLGAAGGAEVTAEVTEEGEGLG